MYKCKFCGKEFEKASSMRGHLISCLKNPKVIEKVNCQYCNKLFSLIQLKRHEKYCHENPNGSKFNVNSNSNVSNELRDDLFCRYCNKQCKNLNSQKQHEIRCKENPDRIATAIIRNFNVSKNFTTKGLTPWNKGLTKETDPRLLPQANSQKGNNHWLGKHHSEESKAKTSATMQFKVLTNTLKQSPTSYKFISCNIQFKDGQIQTLRSSYEIIFVLYLNYLKIPFKYESERVSYINSKNEQHIAVSDFLIGTNHVFEVKGRVTQDSILKINAFTNNEYIVDLILLDKISDCKKFLLKHDVDVDSIIKKAKIANNDNDRILIHLDV